MTIICDKNEKYSILSINFDFKALFKYIFFEILMKSITYLKLTSRLVSNIINLLNIV